MKRIPTAAQEASLRKLFAGNHNDREQVISIHPPEMRQKLRKFIQVKGNIDKLFGILFSDLTRAGGQVRDHPEDQFLRRATVRCFAATVDGIIYGLKQTTLASGDFLGRKFTDEELSFLNEEMVEPKKGKKTLFRAFHKNIKQAFILFAKVYGVSCPTDFTQDGFQALCETCKLRNRLMHPKSLMNFCVSDEEKQRCADASAWLHLQLNCLIDACQSGLQNS